MKLPGKVELKTCWFVMLQGGGDGDGEETRCSVQWELPREHQWWQGQSVLM